MGCFGDMFPRPAPPGRPGASGPRGASRRGTPRGLSLLSIGAGRSIASPGFVSNPPRSLRAARAAQAGRGGATGRQVIPCAPPSRVPAPPIRHRALHMPFEGKGGIYIGRQSRRVRNLPGPEQQVPTTNGFRDLDHHRARRRRAASCQPVVPDRLAQVRPALRRARPRHHPGRLARVARRRERSRR